MKPDHFIIWLDGHNQPIPVPEFRFHLTRRWRFDYAWPHRKVALEVEGGTWVAGRHNRALGFRADCEKYSEAAIAGWCLIRRPSDELMTEQTLDMLGRAFDLNPVTLP